MKEAAEKALKELAEKAGNATKSHESMQFAQAALNLAHVLATLDTIK